MSFGSKALQVLKTVAPELALALGGPFGGIASAAVSAALGTPTGDDKAAEAALLAATPDQLLALQNSRQAFMAQMKQLGIDEAKLSFDDTANARAREIATKDNTPKILGYGIIIFTMFFEGWLLIHGMPKDLDPQYAIVAGRILGTFDTASALVLGYFYGTSAGSASKTDALNTIAVTK